MNSTLTKNQIDINTAAEWTKCYREDNLTGAKAFLVPVYDLLNCMEEMGIIKRHNNHYHIDDIKGACVRAYLAVNPEEKEGPSKGEKLLVVGTKHNRNGGYSDIVEGEKPNIIDETFNLNGLKGSGVYDFTTPCPNECDANSPLVSP